MAIDFPLTASQPFSITLPTTATVNSAGEVVCDLSANATEALAAAAAAQATADGAVTDAGAAQFAADGAQADATQALSDAADAQETADDAVPKSDPVAIYSSRLSLIVDATGTVQRIRAGFDGTLTEAQIVIDGVTTAVGACSVAITIDDVPAPLTDALSVPTTSAAGFGLNTTFNPAVAFTRYQVIGFTVTSANTSATFGTVTLGATRT